MAISQDAMYLPGNLGTGDSQGTDLSQNTETDNVTILEESINYIEVTDENNSLLDESEDETIVEVHKISEMAKGHHSPLLDPCVIKSSECVENIQSLTQKVLGGEKTRDILQKPKFNLKTQDTNENDIYVRNSDNKRDNENNAAKPSAASSPV